MKAKNNALSKNLEEAKHIVVRVTRQEFELDNGDIYPHAVELDYDMSVDEFQKTLDSSKQLIVGLLKKMEEEAK